MEITQVRIFPVGEEKLKAFASVVLDACFVVCDIKIIDGARGLFVSMPSKKRKNGTFRDVAHPLNSETRKMFEDTIIRRYRETVGGGAEEAGSTGPVRTAGDVPLAAEPPRNAGAGGLTGPGADGGEDRNWT